MGIHTPYRPECRVRPSNLRAVRQTHLRESRGGTRERERADEASSRQLPPLELPPPNRHWPLHESVQGPQHLPQGDRGGPQQDRQKLPKGRLAPTDVHVASPQRRVPPERSQLHRGGGRKSCSRRQLVSPGALPQRTLTHKNPTAAGALADNCQFLRKNPFMVGG